MRRPKPGLGLLRRETLLVGALLLVTACGGGGGTPAPEEPTPVLTAEFLQGPMPFAVEATLEGASPDTVETVRFIVHAKPGANAPDVDVTFERSYLDRTGAIIPGLDSITFPVFGLYAEHDNQVTIEATFSDGPPLSADFEVTTTALVVPADRTVPAMEVDVADAGLGLGFMLFQGRSGPSIVDVDGALRWLPDAAGAAAFPRIRVAEGLVGGDRVTNEIQRIDWLGRTQIFQLDDVRCTASHHNIEMGKTGYLNTVSFDDGAGEKFASVLAEMTATGEVTKLWNFDEIFRDHIESFGEDASLLVVDDRNWFHMNSAIYDASDDSLIVSSRHNFVVKVDYETGAIKWLLGDPGRCWVGDLPLSLQSLALDVTGDAPIGQHALSVTADGQYLMLFNNGKGGPKPDGEPRPCNDVARVYSKVSIYRIDPLAGTAVETWSLDLDQAVYSPVCSSAYRTASGNILVSYASPETSAPRVIVVNDAKQILFDALIPGASCELNYAAEEIPLEALVLE